VRSTNKKKKTESSVEEPKDALEADAALILDGIELNQTALIIPPYFANVSNIRLT
jgi:hypothetical protein